MYDVLLERKAERDLRRLSPVVFKRIIAGIKKLANNPRPGACRKISGSQNDWRIRIGNYRVIYEVDDKTQIVKIMFIKHRKDAYR